MRVPVWVCVVGVLTLGACNGDAGADSDPHGYDQAVLIYVLEL